MKLLLAVFFAGLLGTSTAPSPGTTAAPLPAGCIVPPGNGGLADIVVEVLEASRPLLLTGMPNIGIPPLDPFGPIPPVSFHIDIPGLRMDGTMTETLVKNFAQFVICSLNITVGISQRVAFDLRLYHYHMDGMYELDGLIASLFPVFGDGGFTLDTFETGFSGGAKINYNVFTDRASIKDLTFDVFFNTLEMNLECINGCGDMSDLVNSVMSDIGPAAFDAMWNTLQPLLADLIENGINEYLKNVSISDLLNRDELELLILGTANDFVDTTMGSVNNAIVSSGLDPVELPDKKINIGGGDVDLYQGKVVGLSKMHRSDTCALDRVASWVFLYTNLADESLEVHYRATVTSGSTTSLVTIHGIVDKVEAYMAARMDIYAPVTDLDKFVITEFGNIDVTIDGLGSLEFMLEPLTEAVTNLMRDDIANLLETSVKDQLHDVLRETPLPLV